MVSGGWLPHPPGPGSRFCRWRLARCGWHRGPHLRHVEVGLAVQAFHPPSALTDPPFLLVPSPAVESPSSAIGSSCCGGTGGAEGMCCQVAFRVVSMERWAVSTRMQSRGGEGKPYHISYGDLSPESAVVAIWFRTWNAQDNTLAHKDG